MIQHLTVCTLIVSKICHNVEFLIAISNNPKPHLKIGVKKKIKKKSSSPSSTSPLPPFSKKGGGGVETCANTHPDVRNVKVYWIYWIIRNNNSEYLKELNMTFP